MPLEVLPKIRCEMSLNEINKVGNLAWFYIKCLGIVKSGVIPYNVSNKMKSKIRKYQEKLKICF